MWRTNGLHRAAETEVEQLGGCPGHRAQQGTCEQYEQGLKRHRHRGDSKRNRHVGPERGEQREQRHGKRRRQEPAGGRLGCKMRRFRMFRGDSVGTRDQG